MFESWLVSFLFSLTICTIFSFTLNKFLYKKIARRKLILSPDVGEWRELTDEDLKTISEQGIEEIIISDGESVQTRFGLLFDREGQPLMSIYDRRIATHWRPLPLPPEKNKNKQMIRESAK